MTPLNPSPEMGKVTLKYRAELSHVRSKLNGLHAGWIIESDDGLLCEGMCESEARMVADACNSHAALIAQRDELVRALRSVAKGLRQSLAFKDREMLDTAVRLSADECERAALKSIAGKEGGV